MGQTMFSSMPQNRAPFTFDDTAVGTFVSPRNLERWKANSSLKAEFKVFDPGLMLPTWILAQAVWKDWNTAKRLGLSPHILFL